MKQLRITPLNIASALLLAGVLWRILDGDIKLSTIGWFFLLLLVVVAADQFFRLMLRSLKRVWIAEGVFLVFVSLAIWVIATW